MSLFVGPIFHANPFCDAVRDAASKTHEVSEAQEDADTVIFVDDGYIGVSETVKIALTARGRPVAVFCQTDWPFAYLPGLYPSLTKALPHAFSWSYVIADEPPALPLAPSAPRRLFSFLGRTSTHKVRRELLQLDAPETPIVDVAHAAARIEHFDYKATYARLMAESKFILCPRGFGASSIRLFESMRAGRAPVIISDAWREPPVGDWSLFSIRIRESDVKHIPRLLKEREGDAEAMGARARTVFEENFHPAATLRKLMSIACPMSELGDRLRRGLSAMTFREVRTLAPPRFRLNRKAN
jgi:hypothetical protein